MKIGSIYTFAGSGEPGFGGDGGDARSAMLNEPKGVAIDNKGNIYIADSENSLIRKVDKNGEISTIAGSIAPVPEGEEKGEVQEMLYQRELGAIQSKPGLSAGSIGDGGPAKSARLRFPSAVAVGQDGNLYICDTFNHRIRKVDVNSGIITTIAGIGQSGFGGDDGPATEAILSEPSGIAVDQDGNIYIADLMNHKIRMVDRKTGAITTIAGSGQNSFGGDNGPAIYAALAGPSGVTLDKEGNIYIADTFNNRIRIVDKKTGLISTIAGDGNMYKIVEKELSEKSISRPYSIAIDSKGDLYVTDSDNHMIRKIGRNTGEITAIAGNGKIGFSPDDTPAVEASLSYPFGVAMDSVDNIYIADTFNHRIRKVVTKET